MQCNDCNKALERTTQTLDDGGVFTIAKCTECGYQIGHSTHPQPHIQVESSRTVVDELHDINAAALRAQPIRIDNPARRIDTPTDNPEQQHEHPPG